MHMTKQGWQLVSRRLRWSAAVVGLALLSALAGCGGPAKAPVSGKVTFNGEPVDGGTIVLGPLGSGETKAASAEVGKDGTFTIGEGGAMLGKYRVGYTAPQPKASEDPKVNPEPSKYAGLTAEPAEFEVKAGSNTLDIKLKK
jgi:hypothetical protein